MTARDYAAMPDDELEALRLELCRRPCSEADTRARMAALAVIAEVQTEREEARRSPLTHAA